MNSNKLARLIVGQMRSNCYIVPVTKNFVVVIDPGEDGDYIVGKLFQEELTPLAILATHGHYDHVSAGFTVQAAYDPPFYINKLDQFLLDRMRETYKKFESVDPGPPPIVKAYYSEKTELDIASYTPRIIETPGHTPGSVCIYDSERGHIFVGDLLFADGSIGEVTHVYSNRTDMKNSIKKILALPDETVVYPGHGEETTIEDLKEKFVWALNN